MWNSTSRVKEEGTQYDFPELDAIVNFIGYLIELEEDSSETSLAKDEECDLHYSAYLNGITNGEYIYAVFEILSEMLSDEPFKEAPFYKEAVLASLLDGLRGQFLEYLTHDTFPHEDAQDIWNLYAAIRQYKKEPLWVNDEGKEIKPPSLSKISTDDWEGILEDINDEFLWDRDWELGFLGGTNFALVKVQPCFPSFQEYRTAKTWIMDAYSNTCRNQKSQKAPS
ncbi:MAG TPA: hypothetical protein VGO57_05430 [Verrucomicrobiae bacterium]|jgi:hypothetical protein